MREKGPLHAAYHHVQCGALPSTVDAYITMKYVEKGKTIESVYTEKMSYNTYYYGNSGLVCRERQTDSLALISKKIDSQDVTETSRARFNSNLPVPSFEFMDLDSRGVDAKKSKLGTGVYDLVLAGFDARVLPEQEISSGETCEWKASYGALRVSLYGRFLGSALLGNNKILRFRNHLDLFRPLAGGKRDIIGSADADVHVSADGLPVRVRGKFRFRTLQNGDMMDYAEDFVETFHAPAIKQADTLASELALLEAAYKLLSDSDRRTAVLKFETFLARYPSGKRGTLVRRVLEKLKK